MDKQWIGNNFYELLQDIGEDYRVELPDGEEWFGKLSLVAKTTSTKSDSEREYLMKGSATFPDIKSQTNFRGCYFHREINPEVTYLLLSTMPEPTDERVGDIFATVCNDTVSLAYLEKRTDEKHNTVKVAVPYAENVRCFWDSTLQKQRRSTDGNFEATLYFMQMPARYGISEDLVVLRKDFKWNEKEKKNEIVDVRYRVESVDLSMATIAEDGTVYGTADVQLSKDTRA